MSHPTRCYFCYSLRVQQLFIIFSFQNQKKKEKKSKVKGVWKVSGAYKKKKATFMKRQHQNFCSWSQNWFYATFPPFLPPPPSSSSSSFVPSGVFGFHPSSSGGILGGKMHFRLKVPSSCRCVSIHPVVVLQSEEPLEGKRKPHLVHVGALLSVCCSVAQRQTSVRCMKYRFISNESHVDASREAAGPCDNTVLLMLYKTERKTYFKSCKKCTKVRAR